MIKKYAVYSTRMDSKNLIHFNVDNIQYYDWPDDDIFINSLYQYKLAVLELNYKDINMSKIELDKFKNCNTVVVYSMELTLPIISLICKYDLPNFIFIIPGFLNFNLKNAQLKSRATWILSTSALWLEVFPHLLIEKLNPFIKKQKYVEIMYGTQRRHRTYVADWILKNNLSDYVVQTPFFLNKTNDIPNQIYSLDNTLLWENEIIPDPIDDYKCQYNGVDMLLSQVVPFKIYQQTAFSLICETGFDNSYTFFTEKITKPMLGCRLFVVVSGQFYLKNLKLLGFKTFDGIIDESYDLESNPETRWSMAMEQVKWLCQQDQIKILKSIVPIVLHNRDLLLRLSTNQLCNTIESLLIREELKLL